MPMLEFAGATTNSTRRQPEHTDVHHVAYARFAGATALQPRERFRLPSLAFEEKYSGSQKSWPQVPCISYGSRGHDFCEPLYGSISAIFSTILARISGDYTEKNKPFDRWSIIFRTIVVIPANKGMTSSGKHSSLSPFFSIFYSGIRWRYAVVVESQVLNHRQRMIKEKELNSRKISLINKIRQI